MAHNKVVYGNTTIIDLTGTTATAGSMLSGSGCYGADGQWVNGSISSKAAATYNTSAQDQTIASGQYLSGAQTMRGVTTSGITAANIKAGTVVKVGDANDDDRIAGVTGTFTSDATATAADINSGATAYVNGAKVTGSQVIQHYYTGSSAPSSSLGVNGDIYLKTS